MSEHQQTQKPGKPDSTFQKQAALTSQNPVSHPASIIQRARINPKSLTAADVLQLQRTIGNRAVGRLLSEIRSSPTTQQSPVQRQKIPEEEEPLQPKRENNIGMPYNLKAGVESLSGIDMNNVRVYYNSSKPAEVGALAYTQGTEIHVAPGQEKHLPHEAWHVVQQMEGRVKPTMQMKNGVPVNDDKGLEHEADVMGERAASDSKAIVGIYEATSTNNEIGFASHHLKPLQMSHGSTKANEELIKSMGKTAERVDKLPSAKPHTKGGTGSGGGGTDHQGRNAMVINKAKQDTMKNREDPTMFSPSRMRSDDRAVEKDAAAEEVREEKRQSKKQTRDEKLQKYFGHLPTKKEIKAYEAMEQAIESAKK